VWDLILGWILLNDEKDTVCSRTLDTLRKNGLADGVVEFKSGRDVTSMWEMFDGPMTGSVGYYNPSSVLLPPILSRANVRAGRMQLRQRIASLPPLKSPEQFSTLETSTKSLPSSIIPPKLASSVLKLPRGTFSQIKSYYVQEPGQILSSKLKANLPPKDMF
jgi:hypothetical protein